MSNLKKRTDIRMSDVFISWTSKDRELKNKIVEYLRENKITVLESDYDCVGDFRQWSREAVSKCTVFLSLYTENTVSIRYVPIEIEEFKKIDDWRNRCLPVVSSLSLYSEKYPELAEFESVVSFEGREFDGALLEEVLYKVQMLLNNRLFEIYRDATQPTYLKIKSFLRMVNAQDREYNHESLYINRTVIDAYKNVIDDPSIFTRTGNIYFLQGPAGAGKSCYIDRLRKAADENVIVIALSCRNLTHTTDLFGAIFEEFQRYCGNRHFYTENDLKSLLAVKHLLLVLDGMDEIATKSGTRRFLDAVSNYYVANTSSTTLFFTSRSMADADVIAMNGQIPEKLILSPLTEKQIEDFGKRLFLLLGKPDKSDAFYVRVRDLSDEIRTNPLLLSQLAIIYDKREDIPQTTVGIYDAVCEITFSREDAAGIPPEYCDMVTQRISGILKAFSAERYRLISRGKQVDSVKILSAVLKNTYDDAKERAIFLEEYLRDRAMIIDGEFYHKMLLEYFTAVYYYEHCFDDYDELENEAILKELFAHYPDPYWSAVLQMFLIKADSLIDGEVTSVLYRALTNCGISEYTLLLDTCCSLIRHKEEAKCALVGDILKKSASGIYPPYGPLFWYVPEYDLYSQVLHSLKEITEEECFTKSLALVRDVCWIFGRYNTADEITETVNGKELFAKCKLRGIRRGLCELFYIGATDETVGDNIYPRCFNIAEAKHWKEYGCGAFGRMSKAFEDELMLYSHEMFSELDGEYIGVVATAYERERIETELTKKSCKKLCGLLLSSAEEPNVERPFINDKHLTVVYLPENALSASGAFKQSNLRRTVYATENGLLYYCDTVFLPSGMTEIPSGAFKNCTALKFIDIPGGVKVIGEWAFGNCNALTSVKIPSGVSEIQYSTFLNCTALEAVDIPNGVRKISAGAFYNCRSLVSVTVPESVVEIGGDAFKNCTSLEVVDIREGVKKIGKGAFRDCRALSSIKIPDSVTEIECDVYPPGRRLLAVNRSFTENDSHKKTGIFTGCTSLKRILNCPRGYGASDLGVTEDCEIVYCLSGEDTLKLPDGIVEIKRTDIQNRAALKTAIIPEGVRKISHFAFSDCITLESVVIPDGVTEIGYGAFKNCSALRSVTVPLSVITLGFNAFEGCSSLESIAIFGNVNEIEYGTFDSCSSLKSVTLPQSVKKIGRNAFSDCRALESFTIPVGVRKIDSCAFLRCSALKSITIPVAVTEIEYEAFSGCTSLESVMIPDGVTEIGTGAFSGCRSLKTVTLPDSVKKISNRAFLECTALESVTIGNSVKIIERSAFEKCSSLTSIIISDSVTELGSNVFKYCKSLKSICNCPQGYTSEYLGVSDDCVIEMRSTNAGEAVFKVPNGAISVNKSDIPHRRTLETVIFSESVRKIGVLAFEDCCSLTSILLNKGVETIEMHAFNGCHLLTSVMLPESVTTIGIYAFSRCHNLLSIAIPEGVTKVSAGVFSECYSLRSITLPKGVTKIETNAFKNCRSLKFIEIPDGVTEIDSEAFSGCTALESVIIPDGVMKISFNAFRGCAALQSVVIPASVKNICNNAFSHCVALKEVTISRRFEEDLPRIFGSVDLSKIKISWI